MFYLKLILLFFKKNITLSTMYILSSALLLISFSNIYSNRAVQDYNSHPNFKVLIKSEDSPKAFVTKLESLPGITNVLAKVDKTTALIGAEGFSIEEINSLVEIVGEKIVNLNIYLNPNITQKSQNLLREYISKLIGQTNLLSIGKINTVQPESKEKSFKSTIKVVSNIFFTILWLAITLLFIRRLRFHSFIISSYQRKKNVLLKTTMLTTILTLWGTIILVITMTKTSTMVLSVVAMAMFLIISIFSILLVKKAYV